MQKKGLLTNPDVARSADQLERHRADRQEAAMTVAPVRCILRFVPLAGKRPLCHFSQVVINRYTAGIATRLETMVTGSPDDRPIKK